MMQLVNELALYEKAPEQVTVSFDHFVESGFGSNPVWWAFVATQMEIYDDSDAEQSDVRGEKVIGFALYYIRYSTWKGQRMYLEDLLVTEDMRGRGIGAMLFDQLIQSCKEKKYSGLVWQVLDWNEPAINFYKKYNAGIDAGWLNGSLSF